MTWYEKNRESILLKKKEEYRKNPGKVRLSNEKYKAANREKVLSYKRIDSLKPQRRLTRCKSIAKQKGLVFNILIDWYIEFLKNNCHYCNKELLTESGHSMDRIDNDQGYEVFNVLPCCGDCNKLRGERLTVEETEVAVKSIILYRKKLLEN